MTHFIACTETTGAYKLSNLTLKNINKLHDTPKTAVSVQESILILHIEKKLPLPGCGMYFQVISAGAVEKNWTDKFAVADLVVNVL